MHVKGGELGDPKLKVGERFCGHAAGAMIPFEKSFLGLSTLTPWSLTKGAIPRVLLPSLISALISVAVFMTGLNELLVRSGLCSACEHKDKLCCRNRSCPCPDMIISSPNMIILCKA